MVVSAADDHTTVDVEGYRSAVVIDGVVGAQKLPVVIDEHVHVFSVTDSGTALDDYRQCSVGAHQWCKYVTH